MIKEKKGIDARLLIGISLIISILLVYWQVQYHQFVSYDDGVYVTLNPNVQVGLTWASLTWALTTIDAGFWHPLTWLSLMLDYEVYGLKAGGYHWTNVLFHIANTLLLFVLLERMTGAVWRSGIVAALFALHPLHVESVAWVAERKDVLSTFFWMLTLWSYDYYVRHRCMSRYLLMLFMFILGLMSKPMLMTLPFVLLLLDYWPLGRFKDISNGINSVDMGKEIIREKIPLIVLSLVVLMIAIIAERQIDALTDFDIHPFDIRLANAFVSYVKYIWQMVFPVGLVFFYPLEDISIHQAFLAVLIIGGLTFTIYKKMTSFPFLFVGWFWYLGTLFPVIGLVQIGGHAMADRYTYIPLIGLFILVAWGAPLLLENAGRHKPLMLALGTSVLLLALAFLSWRQVHHWQSSISLYSHAIEVSSRNALAHHNLGLSYLETGMINKAEEQIRLAVKIRPDYDILLNNLGVTLLRQGKLEEAGIAFSKAIKINPQYFDAYYNLGVVNYGLKNYDQAIFQYSEAIKIRRDVPSIYKDLNRALLEKSQSTTKR